ncbi:MAG: nucleotidyltransferase family protein [Acidobacteria bacterium]|nr:nucleotidyltransferase family protein [Acidobacteriota bacterium]
MIELRAPELQFLAAAVRAALGTADRGTWPRDLDANTLVAAAEQHGAIVLLDRVLRSSGAPDDVVTRVRTLARSQTERTLVLTRQLRVLLDLFETHGITALPVKGPVLAATAYGHVGMRGASGDLDLILRAADLDRAVAILGDAGYQRVEPAIDEHDHERWESEAHLLPATAAQGTLVELHTELIGNFYTAPVDLEAVLARCEPRPLFGRAVPVIAAEDLLLYLCLHGARHMWSRLLWTIDLAALLRAHPAFDWDALVERATAIDARHRVALGLHLAAELFDAPVPADVRRCLSSSPRRLARAAALAVQRMDAASRGEHAPGLIARLRCELAVRETHDQRATYLHRQLAPNARDRAWLRLPRGLGWLHWMLRPIRLATRYGGRGHEHAPPRSTRISLAVVIPTYRRTEALRRLLASIEAQTVTPSEVLVVDQNAPGFLDDVLRETRVRLTRVMLDQPNAAAARNAGFLRATSTHVLFLDDDEVIGPEFVAQMLDAFRRHPQVRCLWPIVHFPGKREAALHAWQRFHRRGRAIAGSSIFPVNRAGSGGVAFEREYFRKSGGYDDLLFAFGHMAEDWELSTRMRARGMTIWSDASLFIEHTPTYDGGCAIRTAPYEEIRRASARACMFRQRIAAAPPFRLRLRDLVPIARFSLLSSMGRADARRAVLRHPLWHLRMIADARSESRELLARHGARYSDAARVDHLTHADVGVVAEERAKAAV